MDAKTKRVIDKAAACGWTYDFSASQVIDWETPFEIICHEHGVFLQTPRKLLVNKYGCPKCGEDRRIRHVAARRLTTEQFITKARHIHQDAYDYSAVEYVNSMTKVKIVCPLHGEFLQTPNNHVSGKQQCPKCSVGHGEGGYTFAYFEARPHMRDKTATLYALDVASHNDRFLKVGITVKPLSTRFNRSEYKHMNIYPLFSKNTTLYDAYTTEQALLTTLSSHRFYPNDQFSGYTECLKRNAEVMTHLTLAFLG